MPSTPSCSPSSATTRTSRTLICSFTLRSLLMSYHLPNESTPRFEGRRSDKQAVQPLSPTYPQETGAGTARSRPCQNRWKRRACHPGHERPMDKPEAPIATVPLPIRMPGITQPCELPNAVVPFFEAAAVRPGALQGEKRVWRFLLPDPYFSNAHNIIGRTTASTFSAAVIALPEGRFQGLGLNLPADRFGPFLQRHLTQVAQA